MKLDEIGYEWAGIGMTKKKKGRSTEYVVSEAYALWDTQEESYVSFESPKTGKRKSWKIQHTANPSAHKGTGVATDVRELQMKLERYKKMLPPKMQERLDYVIIVKMEEIHRITPV
jgi:hypothetical protein